MIRSIAAVAAGAFVTVVMVILLSFASAAILRIPPDGTPTPLYLVLNLLGGLISGICGGAIAVRLAPHRPRGHVFTLAFVILLLSLPTLFSAPAPGQPAWYGLVISVLGPVSVLIGGLLSIRSTQPGPEEP